MATASIVFDRPSYGPTDPIGFTVTVDVPMTDVTTVTGSVELPGGEHLPATSVTTVSGVYGPFTASGYTVAQDPEDPSRFVATPIGG